MTETLDKIAPQFTEKKLLCCDVEYADIRGDVVYHFWPQAGCLDFPDNFAVNLENAFKLILPQTADVRAEYIDRREASVFMRFNDDPNVAKDPVPTYCVRVIGWADNPMSDVFLKSRVFYHLDSFYEETA